MFFRTKSTFAVAVAAAFMTISLSAFEAQAVPIDPTELGAFNTGVDSTGAVVGNNQVDQHYTLVAPTTGSAFTGTDGNIPDSWLGNNDQSRWIGPVDQNVSADFRVSGGTSFTYETTIDLTGFILSSVSLSGQWATDNGGSDILLNGSSTGQTASGFQSFSDNFVLDSGFVEGVNTIQFIVRNAGTTDNPSGLRVEFTAAEASLVPLPASLFFLLAGLGALAGLRRTGQAA